MEGIGVVGVPDEKEEVPTRRVEASGLLARVQLGEGPRIVLTLPFIGSRKK